MVDDDNNNNKVTRKRRIVPPLSTSNTFKIGYKATPTSLVTVVNLNARRGSPVAVVVVVVVVVVVAASTTGTPRPTIRMTIIRTPLTITPTVPNDLLIIVVTWHPA
mmetsp:Transcript_6498/g.16679  ORF Transcript_6498/g.16679 Transcript_6498/m.16679 type:complete len:106 (-) Transcript_6498:1167-1484(-)